MGKRGNGEGSITKREDGRYMARYTVPTMNGPKRKTLYGKTRKEAADKLARAVAGQDGTLAFDAGNLKTGEFLKRWLRDSVKDTVRPSTHQRYEQVVRLHIDPAFGAVKLKSLSPAHVQGLYREKLDYGLAPATVQKIHVVLHKALKQAVRWSLVPRNVAEAVIPPKPGKEEMHPLSADEAKSLFRAAREGEDRLEALYVLAVTTGMRQGELLGLKWEDVDLEREVLQVRRTLVKNGGRLSLGEPKTKKSRRTVHLTGRAVGALKRHRKVQAEERLALPGLWQNNGLVFATNIGTLINPTNLRRRSFAPLLEKAGLSQIRFHDLRHTAATLLFLEGVHPKFVQELLGHATIAITLDTYSHVQPSMGDRTAKAMEAALS